MEGKRMENVKKYQRQYHMPPEKCTKWAQKEYVEKAPSWCSVDLRDGNQALVIPMSLEQKNATVELASDVADEVLIRAVTDAGYEVKGVTAK